MTSVASGPEISSVESASCWIPCGLHQMPFWGRLNMLSQNFISIITASSAISASTSIFFISQRNPTLRTLSAGGLISIPSAWARGRWLWDLASISLMIMQPVGIGEKLLALVSHITKMTSQALLLMSFPGLQFHAQLWKAVDLSAKHPVAFNHFNKLFPSEIIAGQNAKVRAWDMDPSKLNPYAEPEAGKCFCHTSMVTRCSWHP